MDKYKVLFSKDAMEDIFEITRYIKETFAMPKLSEKYYEELFETIKNLEFMPKRFEIVKMKYIKRDNIRRMIYKHYLAFYIINEEKKEVYILRVRHGRTDWKNI